MADPRIADFSFGCAVQIHKHCSEEEIHLMDRSVVPLGTKETGSMAVVPKLVRPLEELRKVYSSQ